MTPTVRSALVAGLLMLGPLTAAASAAATPKACEIVTAADVNRVLGVKDVPAGRASSTSPNGNGCLYIAPKFTGNAIVTVVGNVKTAGVDAIVGALHLDPIKAQSGAKAWIRVSTGTIALWKGDTLVTVTVGGSRTKVEEGALLQLMGTVARRLSPGR